MDIYGVRKELMVGGSMNSRLIRWLDKVLMVNYVVSVSSLSVCFAYGLVYRSGEGQRLGGPAE
eukprot:5044336-Pyramimonas_sp.AAC.1